MNNLKIKIPAFIILVTVLFAVAIYFAQEAGLQNSEQNPERVQIYNEQDPRRASPPEKKVIIESDIVGFWKFGGGDFHHAEVEFLANKKFFLSGYYIQSPEDSKYAISGTWSVIVKGGVYFLKLDLDESIKIPSTPELIEQYKRWGQEYISDKEVLLKLDENQDNTIDFRWDGGLMNKELATEQKF